jgi:hypothetical protein
VLFIGLALLSDMVLDCASSRQYHLLQLSLLLIHLLSDCAQIGFILSNKLPLPLVFIVTHHHISLSLLVSS